MEEENKVEENVQPVETPVETTPVVETSPVVEEVKEEQPKENKPKNNKPMLIVLLIIFMAFIFGCGMYLGKQLFEKENKCSCNCEPCNNEPTPVPTPEPEPTLMIKDITDEVKTNTNESNIYIAKRENEDYDSDLYINNKAIFSLNGYKGLDKVYGIEDNYLITISGTDIHSEHYYLYDKDGTLLQEIYELEDNNMVIASSDKYNSSTITINNNTIELYGLRLYGTTLLVANVNGLKSYLNICNNDEISKANVEDDYVVVARYQLIYSNNKFDIKRVEGTEETLGQYKAKCTNG